MPKPARGSSSSLKETVYTRIRDDILSLALHPGTVLDEETLSARYRVSRTPIREALIRLSAEGLIIIGRKRQAQVTPLIMSDLPRYLEALELLQRSVSYLAAHRRLQPDLDKLHQASARFIAAVDSGDLVELAAANTAFHVTVAEAGHNSYLTEAYTQILTQGQRMIRLPLLYTPKKGLGADIYLARELQQHAQTIQAIEAGDANAAEAIGRQHCEHFRSELNHYLSENLTDGIAVNSIYHEGNDVVSCPG